MEAYFQGKKELFEGLAMEKLEKDWIRYPVLHLDLNIEKYDTPESLDKILHDNLDAELHEFAEARGVSYDKLCDYLKAYYDGYHFTHHSIGGYSYLSGETAEEASLRLGTDAPRGNGLPGAEQYRFGIHQSHSGALSERHLTIKGYDEEFGMYRLGFPNREVEEGFVRFLLPFYANVNKVESPFEIQKFVREVRSGDYYSFFLRLQSFFANTTYEVIREQELHYENVFFIVFKLVGFYTQVEYHTSKGRIDLVLQTDKLIYVMEFKLDGTAEEALQQIHDKHYALPFASDGRKLFKIGVNFSAETRNIEK